MIGTHLDMPRLLYAEELPDGTTAIIVQHNGYALGGVAVLKDYRRTDSPPMKFDRLAIDPGYREVMLNFRFVWSHVVDVEEFRRSRGWERGPEKALPAPMLAMEHQTTP